jgi:hypothetical protein
MNESHTHLSDVALPTTQPSSEARVSKVSGSLTPSRVYFGSIVSGDAHPRPIRDSLFARVYSGSCSRSPVAQARRQGAHVTLEMIMGVLETKK